MNVPIVCCSAKEQSATLKTYCHPSRGLFRAGDLLFLGFACLNKKQQIFRSAVHLVRDASWIAAERGMTVTWVYALQVQSSIR